MAFLTRNPFSYGQVFLAFAIGVTGLLLNVGSASADEVAVPPGFQRLPNGDIQVDDPTIAMPPPGYHISSAGILEKEEGSAANSESTANTMTASSEFEEIPPGFHRMPNGDIMANNPSRAVAPEGYRLTEGGILKRLDDDLPDMAPAINVAAAATIDDFGGQIPSGYHTMPDGTVMANNPSKAKAPEGYHLMPDGTLMADGASADATMHSGHGAGGMLMAEYKFERMEMSCCLDTTNEVSPQEVLDRWGYTMAPTDMTMDMHMLMLMYHTTKYMVMLMAHYMSNDMGMLSYDGTNSTMKTSGIADTLLTVELPWRYNLDFTLGMSFPTGSIDERGIMQHDANNADEVKYPYGMQLGSGTYDVILGIGYEDSKDKLAWGADYEYTLRTGTNDNDYTLGDKSILEGWMRFNFTNTVDSVVNLKFLQIGQISGADPEMAAIRDTNMSPTYDESNYGGRRLDLGIAVKYETPQMTSVSAEFSVPVYQDLYGPQMQVDWIAGLKFGYMF